MNNFYLKEIKNLIQQTNNSESITVFQNNIKELAECIYEDFQLNNQKNLPEIMIHIKALTKKVLLEKFKPFVLIILEFLLNIMVMLQSHIDQYFFYFFDPILKTYDEFDEQIKEASELLNDSLFDCFLDHLQSFSKQYSIIKQIIRKIKLFGNEQILLLLLKWIYMIDSFPYCDLTYLMEIFIQDFLHLLKSDNTEIFALAINKVKDLLKRYQEKKFPDLRKLFKILKNVSLFDVSELSEKKKKYLEKEMYNINIILIDIILQYYINAERMEMKVDQKLLKEIYNFFLYNIYLKKYKIQKNFKISKLCFKKLKVFILHTRDLYDKKTVFELKNQSLNFYRYYIKVNRESDFRIFTQIKTLLNTFNKDKVKMDISFFTCLTQIFKNVLKNNKKKYYNQRFQYFVSIQLIKIIEQLLGNDKDGLLIFIRKIYYKIIEPENQIYFQKISIFLHHFVATYLDTFEILQMYAENNCFSNINIFLRFLFEKSIYLKSSLKTKITEFIFKKIHQNFSDRIFDNYIWFIIINCALTNFTLCNYTLYFLTEYMQKESFQTQIQFSQQIKQMLKTLLPILYFPEYIFNFSFIQFITMCLMIIDQDCIYFEYLKFLENQTILTKFKEDNTLEQQCIYFETFKTHFLQQKDKQKQYFKENQSIISRLSKSDKSVTLSEYTEYDRQTSQQVPQKSDLELSMFSESYFNQ